MLSFYRGTAQIGKQALKKRKKERKEKHNFPCSKSAHDKGKANLKFSPLSWQRYLLKLYLTTLNNKALSVYIK